MNNFKIELTLNTDQVDTIQWNKSVQGRIFDQSMMSILQGDDDNNNNYQNISPLAPEISDRQTSAYNMDDDESSTVYTISQGDGDKNYSPKKLEDKVIFIEMSSVVQQLDNDKSREAKNPSNRVHPDNSNGIFFDQKDWQSNNSSENNEKNKANQINNASSGQDQLTSELSKEKITSQQQGCSILNMKKNSDKAVRESIVNFEKATHIINQILSKSLNRVERVNQYTQDFINLLKMRKNNRKVPQMQEKEYHLLNDAAYYHVTGTHSKLLLKIMDYFYYLTKLKNPFPPFMPTDMLRVYWDIFQVIFTYSFIYVYSVLVFFGNKEHDTPFIQYLFKYTFFVFLFDTLINFNTAYFDKDCIITNRKQIAWKYISSDTFITDCINLLVMGWKAVLESSDLVYNPDNKLRIFFVNILIFLKLNGIKQKRTRFSYVYTLKENQKHIMRLIDQLLTVIAVAHFISVAWYSLGEYELQNGYSICWLDKYGFSNLTYLEKYIYSLYWSITTMTTVGYGDISASNYVEALFITIAMIIFSCVFAYSINNIGFILQEIEKSSKQLNDNITTAQRYLNRKNVNIALQSRVRHYLSFLAKEQKDRDQEAENSVLSLLSNKLRDEIMIEINSKVLNNYALFSANFSQQFLRKLVFIMEEVLISPNEIIFEEGDSDDQSIYLIENGNIEIYQNTLNESRTHLLQSISAHQQFGELSFFSGLARQASARSVNLSTLFKINRSDFIELVKESNEDFERFKMIEQQIRISKNVSPILIECYSCNKVGHIAKDCPNIHQLFDTQFKILKHNFTLFQDRNTYKQRRAKRNPLKNSLILISKNNEVCLRLKDDLQNFNSYTEMVFKTEYDLYSEKSEYQETKIEDCDYSDSSNNSTEKDSANLNSLKSLPTLFKGNSKREKMKSLKKFHTKKLLKQLSKQKEETSGAKDIDNLEYIINTERAHILKNKTGVNNVPTSNNIEETDVNKIYSNTLIEKSDFINQKEALERGVSIINHINHDQVENAINQGNSPRIKFSNSAHFTNSSSKEFSSKHIEDISIINNNHNNNNNNANNHNMNTNNNNEESKNKQLTQLNQQKRKYPLQGNGNNTSFKHVENQDDQNLSNSNNINDKVIKALSNSYHGYSSNNATIQKPQNTDQFCRTSIDAFLAGALQSAQYVQNASQNNAQSDINRIEKTLIQLEDKIQRFLTVISSKNSMKNLDIVKSNKKLPCSTVNKKLSGFSNEQRHSQQQQQSGQRISFKEKSLANLNNVINNYAGNSNNNINIVKENQQQLMKEPQNKSTKLFEVMANLFGVEQNLNLFSSLMQLQNGVILDESNLKSNIITDNFDSIKNFKKFFPHNNFTSIFQDIKQKKFNSIRRNRSKKQSQSSPNKQKRRQQIILSPKRSLFCSALIHKQILLSEINFDNYKPTFLSYGVSQKSDSIFPKNNIKFNIHGTGEAL